MICDFATALTKRLNEYKNEMGYTYFKESIVKMTVGRRFVKVFSIEINHDGSENNRRLVAFVEILTGDIFKPASFNAPAKHARGNVKSPLFGMEGIGKSGHVIYLRG
jgi:hypothetical protein